MHMCASYLLFQLATCDYHVAAVTTTGRLFTFGSKEHGKLGLGRNVPSGSVGPVSEVTTFLDGDENSEMDNVKIRFVSLCRLPVHCTFGAYALL